MCVSQAISDVCDVSLSDSPQNLHPGEPGTGALKPYRRSLRRTAKLFAAAMSAFELSAGNNSSAFERSVGKIFLEIRLFVYIRLTRTHHLNPPKRNKNNRHQRPRLPLETSEKCLPTSPSTRPQRYAFITDLAHTVLTAI